MFQMENVETTWHVRAGTSEKDEAKAFTKQVVRLDAGEMLSKTFGCPLNE